MKILTLITMSCILLSLSACGKSELEEQVEKDTATSKKMGSDPSRIPHVKVAPDTKSDKEGSR